MRERIKAVPDRLKELGNIYSDRNKVYGDNYKHFGKAMKGIFPRGVTLNTEEEFNRFCIFVQVVSKATRYGQSFERGGHKDSLDDTAVYSQMLAEVDEETKAKAEADRIKKILKKVGKPTSRKRRG